MDYKEKLSILTELIKLARADKEIRDVEYAFLSNVAEMLNIEHADFEKLFNDHIEFTPPKLEADRIIQFHRLVLLMNVDKESSQKEIDHIRTIGIRMGLNPSATEAVLQEMNNYENKVVPPERLIEIFKTFHN